MVFSAANDQAHLPAGANELRTPRNLSCPAGQVQRLVRRLDAVCQVITDYLAFGIGASRNGGMIGSSRSARFTIII